MEEQMLQGINISIHGMHSTIQKMLFMMIMSFLWKQNLQRVSQNSSIHILQKCKASPVLVSRSLTFCNVNTLWEDKRYKICPQISQFALRVPARIICYSCKLDFSDREMFDVQCSEGCRLPVLDVIQQINLAHSSLSYEFSGSHAVFITPKSFTKKKCVIRRKTSSSSSSMGMLCIQALTNLSFLHSELLVLPFCGASY